MTEGIKIYECEAEDVDDSIKELWLNLAREMFEIERLTVPSEANANKWVRFIREGLKSRRCVLLVVKSEGRVVGFASGTIHWDFPLEVSQLVGKLDDLYVLPEFRRRGVGKKLVVECLNKMKAAGVKAIRLQVLKDKKAAVKLYEKLGFKIYNYGMIKLIP